MIVPKVAIPIVNKGLFFLSFKRKRHKVESKLIIIRKDWQEELNRQTVSTQYIQGYIIMMT